MLTWSLGCTCAVAGELGDDLVGVHVRRGARAGLEDVDRELLVVLAGGDLRGGLLDARGAAFGEQAKFAVDGGGGALDARQPVDDGDRHCLPGDREVLYRLGGLPAPQLLVRHEHSSSAGWAGVARWVATRASHPTRRTRQLPGEADGIVIGHQKAGALKHAQLTVGQQRERLFGGGERVQSILVGPQQQHGHVQTRVLLEQLDCAPRGHARAHLAQERARLELPGTSAKAWRKSRWRRDWRERTGAGPRCGREHGARAVGEQAVEARNGRRAV